MIIRIEPIEGGYTVETEANAQDDEELHAALIALCDHAVDSFVNIRFVARARHALAVLCSSSHGES